MTTADAAPRALAKPVTLAKAFEFLPPPKDVNFRTALWKVTYVLHLASERNGEAAGSREIVLSIVAGSVTKAISCIFEKFSSERPFGLHLEVSDALVSGLEIRKVEWLSIVDEVAQ